MIRKKWHLICLLLLFCIGAFFAFSNHELRYVLEDETIREAVIGIEGARQLQAPLVGGFSSAGPFTWGPWFYYQVILISLILPTIYAPWIFMGIAYLLSILVLYKIGEILEGKEFGIILSTLGTFSPSFIIGALHLTFPNLVGLYSLVSIFLFIKVVKKNVSYWWSFLLGVILGIGINIHYQTASLLILLLLILIYKRKKILYFISSVAGVSLVFIPLLLFDLTNHWFNLKNITYFFFHGKDAIYVANRWLFYVRDFWPAYWGDVIGVSELVAFGMMIATALVLAYGFFKKKISMPLLLIAIAFFIDFVVLRYYWGERFFAYFSFMKPFVLIFTGYLFIFIYKNIKYGKPLSIIFLVLLIVLVIPKSMDRLKVLDFNRVIQGRVSVLESEYPNQKFNLYICKELYEGNDQRVPKSLLFNLEKNKKISPDGIKIGLEKERCLLQKAKKKKLNSEENKMLSSDDYPQINHSDMYNLSNSSEDQLAKLGWETITFRSIYDSTTRWWFREQP